jgi:hypothetical protein
MLYIKVTILKSGRTNWVGWDMQGRYNGFLMGNFLGKHPLNRKITESTK